MRKSRFSEAQIVGIIKESDAGANTKERCRKYGVSTNTFYKWKAKFGGMDVSDVAKMRAIKDENRRLKRSLPTSPSRSMRSRSSPRETSNAFPAPSSGEGDSGAAHDQRTPCVSDREVQSTNVPIQERARDGRGSAT